MIVVTPGLHYKHRFFTDSLFQDRALFFKKELYLFICLDGTKFGVNSGRNAGQAKPGIGQIGCLAMLCL